ncbi:MAG: response regulator [Ancrocorticia sp.]|uniref:response regulator n=1 Tax=Ancrocorticia sp. TaxID=2593684 RepID=UPI003F8FC2D8
MSDTLSVVAVDDEVLVVEVVAQTLQKASAQGESIELVGRAHNGSDAITVVRELRPDVVLMDLRMPGNIGGVDAIRTISNGLMPPKILALTSFDDAGSIRAALTAGAQGYLVKTDVKEKLVWAIHEVAAGRRVTSEVVTEHLIENFTAEDPGRLEARDLVEHLTPRQVEIARLIGAGNRYEDIARKLFISPSTVKQDVSKALAATCSLNQAQLATIVERAEI